MSDVDRVWDSHLNARALVAFDNAIEDLSDSYHNIFDTYPDTIVASLQIICSSLKVRKGYPPAPAALNPGD